MCKSKPKNSTIKFGSEDKILIRNFSAAGTKGDGRSNLRSQGSVSHLAWHSNHCLSDLGVDWAGHGVERRKAGERSSQVLVPICAAAPDCVQSTGMSQSQRVQEKA